MSGIARRPFLAGLLALVGLGVAGGLVYEVPRLFGRRYPRTPYDDLLDQLPDRESAAKLGKAAMAQIFAPDSGFLDTKDLVIELRHGPGKGSLSQAIEADLAQNRLVEVHGWFLPLSLVAAACIAAEFQPAAQSSA